MPFALPNDDLDLAAKVLITLFDDARLVLQPRIQGRAVMQDRNAGFLWRKIIDRLFACLASFAMMLYISGFRA